MRPLLVLLAIVLLGGCATLADAPRSRDAAGKIEARARQSNFDGLILIGEADGSRRVISIGSPPTPADAVWRWGSITKQFAAVIAMQEIERGKLDLDAPVSRYWPDWRAPHAPSIRIRDLLMHKSGLPQPDASPADGDGIPAFYRSAAQTPSAAAAGFCAGTPRAAPPASFDYNNCDTLVLAEVLARTTGKPFPDLLRERILAPLRLESVGMFSLREPREHVLPIGEFRDLDALLDLGVYGASAGLYGTIDDLWAFDRALMTGKLLSESSREVMWSASVDNGFLNFFQWTYPARLAGCDGPVRIVERQGLVGGIELRNWLLPESGRALILFSRKRPTELGDPWENKGFAFDLLSTVACRP